jgi:hypothetical protein
MTRLAEIQEAILGRDPKEQQALWMWRDRVGLDLEKDTPELEAELLQAVEEPFTPYSPQNMRAICGQVAAKMRRA